MTTRWKEMKIKAFSELTRRSRLNIQGTKDYKIEEKENTNNY